MFMFMSFIYSSLIVIFVDSSSMFYVFFFFFFKQKTAYEMRISDWSSDVCSSDLIRGLGQFADNDLYPAIDPVTTRLQKLSDLAMVQIGRASCRERVCQYV